MSHHHQHEAQRRILRHIGSLIKLQAVGITMDPLPKAIALHLQHLKRFEDERDIDK
jgi:hypothetical protein